MSFKIIVRFALFFSFIFTFNSCNKVESNKFSVFAAIEPQKFFIEKIGGDKVDISVFVKPGMSPENFEPLPSQLLGISNSQIYFQIGMQFENLVIKSFEETNPSLKIIDTRRNINLRRSDSFNSLFEIHEEHHHGLFDPHIWLSPELVKKQAETIYNSIAEADKKNKNFYESNFIKFISEIDSVQKVIKKNLISIKSRNILVYHPAWGYFCDEFNLKQIPVEFEGKEPGANELTKLISFIKKNGIKYILAESQNNSPALHSLSDELKIKIIKHDPLSPDYFNNLISLSEIIRDNN